MATSIDALQIEINARADSANRAINRLTRNLDRLSTSLNSLNITNMGGLATVATQTNAVAANSTRMDNALRKTNATMRTTTKHAKSLASAFGSFYANFFWVIRGAKALWSSIESTADYIEAYNYYNVAFGKIASEWKQDFARFGYDNAEEYAESFTGRMNETLGKLSGVQISVGADGKGLLTDTGMKNLGLNIQEVTQYASQLASVTNSLGQTGETSLAISQSFTKLAGDISSLFNVDYSTVSKNLQSGLIGQSRALYKYGIDITNATLQTYAYELGLTKAVSEMTQAEKQQLRTIAILDQSKVSWGDLANTINSPSNMIRQLSTNLKEAGMVLGQLFIPMLENVLPVVNGTTIAIKRLLTEIAGFFGVEINFNEFGQGYNELEEDNSDLSDSYDDLANSIEEVKSQLLGFDEVNKLSDTSATLSVGTEDNTIDLTDKIVSATEEYQKVWDEAFANMENTSQKWADRVQKALDGVGTVFEDFAIGDFFKAGEDVSQLVIDFNNYISKAIAGVDWQGVGNNVADFFLGIDWSGMAGSFADILVEIVTGAFDFGQGIGESIAKSIREWEKERYGDPSQYWSWEDEHDQNIYNITQKYKDLNEQIGKYVDLSSRYSELSDEEKTYVKQMGEELKNAGIVDNINDITGAWEGTAEALQKALDKQMTYIKLTASQEQLTKLYQELWKLEEERAKLSEEYSELGFGNFLSYLFGDKDARVEGVEGEIDTIRAMIQKTERQINGFKNELNDSGNEMDDTSSDVNNLSGEFYNLGVQVNRVPTRGHITLTADKTQYSNAVVGATREVETFVNNHGNTKTNIKADSSGVSTGTNSAALTLEQYTSKYGNITTKISLDTSALKSLPEIDIDVDLDTTDAREALKKLTSDFQDAVSSMGGTLPGAISGLDFSNKLGIKKFATGGFVDEGQLFIAREAGPELVGSMGGHTAVANNQQITDGIAQAVYSAFTSALSTTNRGSSGDIIINIDGKQVFKAVQKQATNYVAQTGQTPFPI